MREWRRQGMKAAALMDAHLAGREFLVGDAPTIADIALYPYTSMAHEGGYDLSALRHVHAWLARMRALPGFYAVAGNGLKEHRNGRHHALVERELIARAQADMERKLDAPEWTLRQKLALTCRILFDGGHDSGLAGQITARARRPGATTRSGWDWALTRSRRITCWWWTRICGCRRAAACRTRQPLPLLDLPRAAGRELHHPHASAARGVLVDAGGAAGNLAHGQLSAVRRCGLPEGLARRAGRQ